MITKLTSYKWVLFVILLLFLGLFIISSNPKRVSAAYDGGRLIDDGVFLDAASMNAQAVQNFLAARGGAIANKSFVMDCTSAGVQANNSYMSLGAPCGQQVLASQIIYYTAQVYGVNPKVIMATMQKEQSLITATNPTNRQYVQAMGYGCPTTGSCDDASNFFWQVDNGTWVLRFHFERARGNMNWWYTSTTWTCGVEKDFYKPNLYPNQNVDFYDEDGVMYRTHFIRNPATSSFYCYTPHAYNNPQGLYGRAPYGTTGRYYSGSYNFVYFYELWFGSTQLLPSECDSKVSGVVCVWSLMKTDGSQFLTSSKHEMNSAIATYGWMHEGIAFYASNTQREGSVPTYRLRNNNQHHYTIDQTEYNSMKNSGNWVDEGIAFYVYPATTTTNISHKGYRLHNSTLNKRYWTIDDNKKTYLMNVGYTLETNSFNTFNGQANLPVPATGRINVYRLRGSIGYFYTTSLHELNTLMRSGYLYEGVLTTANANGTGTSVYRLRYGNGYFYTTSIAERDKAVNLYGMTSEGVGFFLDNDSNQIYRVANSFSGKYLYTGNLNEVMSVVNTNEWRYEGTLFSKNISPSPVYRFLNLYNNRHFYTININEATRIANKGWKYETIAFSANANSGLSLHRLRLNDRHFYTTNINERDIAVNTYGYIYEGVAFFVSPTTTSKPVYRLQGGNDEYFYTASSVEKDTAVSRYGYRYEGIEFYLP